LYFGYKDNEVYAALKGSKSDMQVKSGTGVSALNAVESFLQFYTGAPDANSYTINGYFYGVNFAYGPSSFLNSAE